jgi:hypothetical protein
VYDFTVILWYLSIVKSLEKIHLIQLPASVVAQIDHALQYRKYMHLPSSSPVNPNIYSIYISLCCNAVHTLVGKHMYGQNDIVIDTDTGRESCTHFGAASGHKKKFYRIPCIDNPVLKINIRGLMLKYKATKDTTVYYMHCPQCGSLHAYNDANWTDTYKCDECLSITPRGQAVAVCTICAAPLTAKAMQKNAAEISHASIDETREFLKRVYFCNKHKRR